MELQTLKIPKKKIEELKAVGIHSLEELVHAYPKKYIDRSTFTGISPEGESIFLFYCTSVIYRNSTVDVIEAIGTLADTTIPVHVIWFNQGYLLNEIKDTREELVLIAGNARWANAEYGKPDRWEIYNPAVYDAAGADALRIYPFYKKHKGMADAYYSRQVAVAQELLGPLEETVPKDILDKYGLMDHNQMVMQLHAPTNAIELQAAQDRLRWDDLLYFALRIEMHNRQMPIGSAYGLQTLAAMNKVKDSLPFTLTNSQQEALSSAIEHIRSGKRLNALIQGDVGCGKTIIAQLLMIAFAGNGYQAAMMAPTRLLAQQHYDNMVKLCEPLNIPIAFIGGGSLGRKEQRKLEEDLANGTIKMVIGTTAMLEEKYKFNNLALVIEDEEHKYGVIQREALAKKVAGGTHTITMSATPIPRSLAQTIYGDYLQFYTIQEKPAGRKPILTGIAPDPVKALAFLKRICREGQQAYVVCPMISANKKMESVASIEEIFELYSKALQPAGIRVGLLTGKMPKVQSDEVLSAFEKGNISVLVSTTVVEVGINVPNANCMIIHNAERFGLAQLHQLRGRVGRGSSNAYCSLISIECDNPRLQAMVQTNDGFEIARMDLQQRGGGDLIGIQQSGAERYLGLAMQYPVEYQNAQAAARDILDRGEGCKLLDQAKADAEAQIAGDVSPAKKKSKKEPKQ